MTNPNTLDIGALDSAIVPVEVVTGQTLEELERTINNSAFSIGAALREIRDRNLYKEAGFDSFESYCLVRWEFSRPNAYRQIDAFSVIEVLSPIGDTLPLNEAQARPLAKLLKQPDLLIEAWGRVKTKDNRTAAEIAKVVEDVKQEHLPASRKPQSPPENPDAMASDPSATGRQKDISTTTSPPSDSYLCNPVLDENESEEIDETIESIESVIVNKEENAVLHDGLIENGAQSEAERMVEANLNHSVIQRLMTLPPEYLDALQPLVAVLVGDSEDEDERGVVSLSFLGQMVDAAVEEIGLKIRSRIADIFGVSLFHWSDQSHTSRGQNPAHVREKEESLSANAVPMQMTSAELEKRLKVKSIRHEKQKHKDDPEGFADWAQEKDPDGYRWYFGGDREPYCRSK